MTNEKDKKKVFNIDEFLMVIGREPLLSAEEELVLIKAIQEKGPKCNEMKRLVRPNLRFVVSVANQYKNKGLSLEELIEVGTEGLKKATAKYDVNAEYKFLSYAVWWIRQAIIQALNEKTEDGNNKKNKEMESLKEQWKKDVQHELEVRMQKLKAFIYNPTSIDEASKPTATIDCSKPFTYPSLKKAVKQFMEEVTARDLDIEGAGVGRETYIFSWNPERFVSQWWQPYLDAIGFEGVTATAPKNSYGVNDGQLLLDYNGCRAVLWEENRDTYFCPLASTDEDFAEERWPDKRFIKFNRLTLSAIVEYLRLMPQITLK